MYQKRVKKSANFFRETLAEMKKVATFASAIQIKHNRKRVQKSKSEKKF